MLHTESARDAIGADDMGTTSKPEGKVVRSRGDRSMPIIAHVDEPATADESTGEDEQR